MLLNAVIHFVGWLHSEIVYLTTDGHPSQY